MTYDAVGNLTNDTYTGAGNRTYDAENKITQAADNTGQVSRYTYDGGGQRVRRQVASSQEEWQIYGFGGELLAEYRASSPASSPQKEYGYRNGQLLVTATGRYNVALAANGAVATASSTATGSGFSTTGAINGNYRGPWGNGEGWNDNTPNSMPDWIQVDFAGSKTIDELSVFSLHDNYTQENTPTETQTFTLYGLLNFNVEYWNGSSWVTIAGGSVTANNKVWRKFTFSPITTSKIRVYITAVPDSWSRVVEIQAFGTSANDQKVQWLISDQLGTPRMILDQSGSLANVKRHDYLPFGEELVAPTGGRSAAQGYAGGDAVRQQFTSQERDVETGLDYFNARSYSSVAGRFTSCDPYLGSARRQTPQSWNRYSYAINNPLTYTDPSGEAWIRDPNGFIFYDGSVTNKKELKKKYGRGYEIIDNRQVIITATKGNSGFKVGHSYTLNADGTKIDHGVYFPPPNRLSSQYGDEMALAMVKLYGSTAFSIATGGTGALSIAITSVGLAGEFLLPEDAPDPQVSAMGINVTISPIYEDWESKGAHIKIDGIELKVHPGDGKVVFEQAFSSDPPDKVKAAIRKAEIAFSDPRFEKKFMNTLRRAIPFLGQGSELGRARSGEVRFLLKLMQKLSGRGL